MENIIHGTPSKMFFIDMLTRDITVSDAIGDLVDNSVDAARKEIYRIEGMNYDLFALKYENTLVEIKFNENEFTIKDNAGGIPFEDAKNYAFCFGRPEDYADGSFGSIGQFGIGMKRSFFKIGKKITVESSTVDQYFKIVIDVEEWKKTEDWNFSVAEMRDSYDFSTGYGTKITITDLTDSSRNLFSRETYINQLKSELEKENWYNLSKGMKITINDIPLEAKDLSVIEDPSIGLITGRWQHYYKEEGVDVRIVCGVGKMGKKDDGGWYIFCNDRCILYAEQTKITGWSGKEGKSGEGPMYHTQYQRFRGFVFFEAPKPKDFPWNTSKTSLNPEHPLYLKVRSKMVDMMRNVIPFLNNLKDENLGKGRGKNIPLSPTALKLEEASSVSIKDLAQKTLTNTKFTAPETIKPESLDSNNYTLTDSTVISYEVDTEKFQNVSKHLKKADTKEIGLETFEYYYQNEIA